MSEDEKVKIALEFIETHAKLRAVVRAAIGEIAHDAVTEFTEGTGAKLGYPEMDTLHARVEELRKSWEIANGRAT